MSLSVKAFLVYCCLEKFYTAISSVIDLSNKFVDWKCFGYGWCLMDAFRLNYFIRSRQIHSNNRWCKFYGSIRKLFMCMDHNLAWLYFSANEVFGDSTYVIHWHFAIVSVIVEPTQWLIQCPYHHSTKRFTEFCLHGINHLSQTIQWCCSIMVGDLRHHYSTLFLIWLVSPLK